MQRILVFGNSGSGKSTLAARLRDEQGLAHLDLDVLAWLPTTPPERRPLAESGRAIDEFVGGHDAWVIEGCYADLLELAAPLATEAIFLNLSVAQCQANARARPWEPHKYPSRAAQDANLPMLLDWIAQYPERDDVLSLAAHRQFFEAFPRRKQELTDNAERLASQGRPG
ncbi:MAG: shikimate kinase [Haliea sp.]|uniref:shikimate kinase n=1 Tax=Haliea sp. TaxID=1932666 RepID=UPI0032ECB91B